MGSIPMLLIDSRLLRRGDVSQLGDRSMGARNVAREIGWGAGTAVGVLLFVSIGTKTVLDQPRREIVRALGEGRAVGHSRLPHPQISRGAPFCRAQ